MWIRLQVRFHDDDNEPLAKDLLRYGKGPRRLARLLTLATYGLVHVQQKEITPSAALSDILYS